VSIASVNPAKPTYYVANHPITPLRTSPLLNTGINGFTTLLNTSSVNVTAGACVRVCVVCMQGELCAHIAVHLHWWLPGVCLACTHAGTTYTIKLGIADGELTQQCWFCRYAVLDAQGNVAAAACRRGAQTATGCMHGGCLACQPVMCRCFAVLCCRV
jgi:hypothetical protein